mgnify:CR=1 FL=1
MTTEMVNNVEMIPNLIWFQNKESVIIDINKVNSDNYDLKIDEKNFNYNTTLNNTIYKINFELFDEFEKFEHKIYNNQCRVIIYKKEETSFWTRLTSSKNLYKNNIKINWNNWVDEDDDEEENMDNNMDMESMMRAMGGGGMPGMGMPGMEGMGMPDMEGMGMPDMEGMDMEGGCCDNEEGCCDDEKDDCCKDKECCDEKERCCNEEKKINEELDNVINNNEENNNEENNICEGHSN